MIPIYDDNPVTLVPWVTFTFIGICVVVYLWQFSLDPATSTRVIYSLGMIPAVITGAGQLPADLVLVPPAASVMTSMFMHGSFMHLIGNMLYLWIFGNNIEDAMGHLRFAVFFVLCGCAAAALQIAFNPGSQIPMVGASGAVSGILGAYLLLYPHARVLVAIPIVIFLHIVRIPAAFVLIVWFAVQIVSSVFATPGAPGVAWYAHIGGFIAGLLLIPLFKSPNVPLLHPSSRPEH